ncbi:MAG: xanthine dehydrogenase accessory protein XdhC [Rhodobacteraceae bacterium]|nr:xanthine dehydrogenase accessory protein XdhC [Paracoccaceae bacterium]
MTLEREGLARAVAREGRVARVVVAAVAGSAPREAGAAMLVWDGARGPGQAGSIGGGALEWQAVQAARAQLAGGGGGPRLERLPLGPALGQCCGGAVTLVTEIWDADRLAALGPGPALARPVTAATADGGGGGGGSGGGGEAPLAVRRLLARARATGVAPGAALVAGWLVEAEARPARALWVWGAGHVGRAIVATLAPLPDLAITWIDTAPDRFPKALPEGVAVLVAADPVAAAATAPAAAEHLVLTFSHALDLALCHVLLGHGFGGLGLIGSASKRARFRARLATLGHGPGAIDRIRCPIGDPALGKHPQAIAIGVAAALLSRPAAVGDLAAEARA